MKPVRRGRTRNMANKNTAGRGGVESDSPMKKGVPPFHRYRTFAGHIKSQRSCRLDSSGLRQSTFSCSFHFIILPCALVEFDAQTWHALNLLSRETMKTFQELAGEAFRDLLHKYARPPI